MPSRRISFLVLLLLAFCLLPIATMGQSATATLSGTVTDANGAVVPAASVTVMNPATGLQRQAITNDQGSFTIPLLPPSTYTVAVEGKGFAPAQVNNLVLNVGDQKALQIQLKAGDVNATVTIDSNAETVRTDGSVGTVVDRQFVANIPLNGRSLQALVQLTPGVVLTQSGSATGGGQFSVNGQRTTANYFMVDGVSANTGMATSFGGGVDASGTGQTAGTTALGGTNSLVSVDALQEFRIETSSFAAEYGRTPGGQISLLTRAGTNQFHGSASEYFRNEAMDANNWFANAHGLPKPKERQNLFGGVLGGPLYLPRFGEGGRSLLNGKNRLFFFASYEGLRLQQPQVVVLTVPTAELRRQAAPALRPYLNALPLPNGIDFGDGSARLQASYSDPGTFNIFGLRLDGRLTDKVTAFFRFNHAPSEVKSRIESLSTILSTQVRDDSYTGGTTWVASSRLTADFRINWTRNAPWSTAYLDSFGGAVVPGVSDIFAPGRNPSNSNYQFGTFAGGFTWGVGNTDVQRQFNAVGTVAWSLESHQFKAGVDYRRLLPLLGGTGRNDEAPFFNSQQDIVAGTALFAYLDANDSRPREPLISNLSLFAQDTWHASRRLTLTYGLRFERIPPPKEGTGRLPRTLLGIETSVLQNPRLAPIGTPLWHSRFGELAPRLGAAYQVTTRSGREMTLRGGAGIFYDLGLGNIANAFEFAFPDFSQRFLCCFLPFPLNPADRTSPSFPLVSPLRGSSFQVFDPNLRMPHTIQWNVAVEQALGPAQAVTISYVGAAGHRLLIGDHYETPLANVPSASFVNLDIQRNGSKSSYKALQVQFQRRLQRGLQALASYTLGRSEDDVSMDAHDNFAAPSSQPSVLGQQYGPSDYDVRHVFSAAVTYDLPKVSGPKPLRILSRDWGLDVLVRYQSPFPVTPRIGGGKLSDNTFFIARPNLVPGQPLYINDPTVPGGRRFNRAAFAKPPSGQQGNFPRNGLRAFPASQVDLAMRREFKLGERVRLQLRGELFNVFNHPNFGNIENSVTNPLFGQPYFMLNRALGGLNQLYQMGGPRSGQLAVKIVF
jgi:hypothetical protein